MTHRTGCHGCKMFWTVHEFLADVQMQAKREREELALASHRSTRVGPCRSKRFGDTTENTGHGGAWGGAGAVDKYAHALTHDDVTLYDGHARNGAGPDFGHLDNPEDRQFNMPTAMGRLDSDLHRLVASEQFDASKHRIWGYAACSSERYVPQIRELISNQDLDLVVGKQWGYAGGSYARAFLEGLLAGGDVDETMASMNALEGPKGSVGFYVDGVENNPSVGDHRVSASKEEGAQWRRSAALDLPGM